MHAPARHPSSVLSLHALPPPATVSWLGFGGLIPFIAPLLLVPVVPDQLSRLLQAQQLYAAVILSFLGAMHWGLAMLLPELSVPRQRALFAWSVMPALIGWLACLLGGVAASVLLALGLALQYACDHWQTRCGNLPAWYLRLRIRLSSIAILSLLIGIVRLG